MAQTLPRPSRIANKKWAAGSPRSFERQEEAKSTLDRQQDLSHQIDEASRQLRESLQQATERRAFDEQLTRKLNTINKKIAN